MKMRMIEALKLSKYYGPFIATKDVTFSVPTGQVAAFLGPNGAGKSTTIKCLTGLLRPSSGSMRILGLDPLVEQFFPTARVEVEIAGVPPAVHEGLRGLPGVTTVTELARTNGAGRWLVESDRDRDVRGEIFRLAAARQWTVLELKRVGASLEEVFLRVVAGDEAPTA